MAFANASFFGSRGLLLRSGLIAFDHCIVMMKYAEVLMQRESHQDSNFIDPLRRFSASLAMARKRSRRAVFSSYPSWLDDKPVRVRPVFSSRPGRLWRSCFFALVCLCHSVSSV